MSFKNLTIKLNEKTQCIEYTSSLDEPNIMENIVEIGTFEEIQKAYENGVCITNDPPSLLNAIADRENLHMLKWMYNKLCDLGFTYFELIYNMRGALNTTALSSSIKTGKKDSSLTILKWIIEISEIDVALGHEICIMACESSLICFQDYYSDVF